MGGTGYVETNEELVMGISLLLFHGTWYEQETGKLASLFHHQRDAR